MGYLDSSSTRAVFFDLAGTLIKVRGGIGAQYAAIARDYGVEADAGAIDHAFPQALASAASLDSPGADAGEIASLEKSFWKQVVRLVFAEAGALARFPDGQFDACFERLFRYFETAAPWTIYPDVVPVLMELKRHDLIVGLITNFDYRVFRLIDALDLSRFIDSITIPALAGAAKPEPAIFEHALGRHGLSPEESIQVGDSFREDVEGARAAGLQAVLIDRKGREDVPAGTASISSLEELLPLLGLRR